MADTLANAAFQLARRDEAGCTFGNEYDGKMNVRISSVFVILIGSTLGTLFPVFAKKNPGMKIPDWSFFIAKYFGSGVIIATAFIHLLAPANEALGDPCLKAVIPDYPWVEGISMMAVFSLFFVELLAMRYATFSSFTGAGAHDHSLEHSHGPPKSQSSTSQVKEENGSVGGHLSHEVDHTDIEASSKTTGESYAAQLTAIFILEFGVIFHSIFVGLTLAVSGDEFITLYIVIVFHQTFEGLGLGTRLALIPWPQRQRWTPYIMAVAYGMSTPLAIAIGLGVRQSYPPESTTTLIVNGVFDSISAGILLYTGLVELMAHEFLFSHELRNAKASTMFAAFTCMVSGAGLMALLGKWA